MHVLLYRSNGSPQIAQQFTGPGRSHFGQDQWDIDHVCNEGDVITMHLGYGLYRTYVVAACDGKVALLQQQ